MEFNKTYISLVEKHSGNVSVFFQQLTLVANRLGIKPDWLANVMYIESGFNPRAKNPNSSATGLIQFMASTAKGLGTSVEAISKMNNIQQMIFVEKYLKGQISSVGKPRDWFETYLLVFYPAWVGKPENATLASSAYPANSFIDLNRDKVITKAEFRKWANSQLPKSILQSIADNVKK